MSGSNECFYFCFSQWRRYSEAEFQHFKMTHTNNLFDPCLRVRHDFMISSLIFQQAVLNKSLDSKQKEKIQVLLFYIKQIISIQFLSSHTLQLSVLILPYIFNVFFPLSLFILVNQAHFKRKFVSRQTAAQKSIQIWTLATTSPLLIYGTQSNGKYADTSLEKYIYPFSRVESKTGFASCIKTLSTSEIKNFLLILPTS